MRVVALVLLWLAVLALPAEARLKWQPTGPGGGGAFESIAVSKDGAVVIGSDLSGAYRTIDGGKSWIDLGFDHGLSATHVDAMAFDETRSGTLILATDSGLFLSRDCAAKADARCRFRKVADGFFTSVAASGGRLFAAALDGYCLAGSHILVSEDGGAQWRKTAGGGLPRNANVMAFRIDPAHATHVIAISAAGRFSGPQTCGAAKWPLPAPKRAYVSSDSGAHFSEVNFADAPATDLAVEDVKFAADGSARVWATLRPDSDRADAGEGAVYVAQGFGQPFKRVGEGHSGQIWPLTSGAIRLYDFRHQRPWDLRPTNAIDNTGFWQFDPHTEEFSHVTPPEDYLNWDAGWQDLVISPGESFNGGMQSFTPQDDTTAWLVDTQLVFKTTDGGRHVDQSYTTHMADGGVRSRGVYNAVPGVLLPHDQQASIVYAGYFDMGCWFTRDAQKDAAAMSWHDCNGPKQHFKPGEDLGESPLNKWWKGYGGNATAIALDPVQEGMIWAALSQNHDERATDPKDRTTIAGSSDGFLTYANMTFDLNDITLNAAVVGLWADEDDGHRRLWAAANGTLYRLDSDAQHWQHIDMGACEHGVLVLAAQGDTMLAGGSRGVCVSHDKGKAWRWWRNARVLGEDKLVWWGAYGDTMHGVSDFAFDPRDRKHVWMTVIDPSSDDDAREAGLWESHDGGDSFAQVERFATGAFERNFARTVAVNPQDPKMVVVGTSSASAAGWLFEKPQRMGAFISRDGGKSFTQENDGLAWPFITRLRFTAGANPRLFAVSPGQGIVFSDVR